MNKIATLARAASVNLVGMVIVTVALVAGAALGLSLNNDTADAAPAQDAPCLLACAGMSVTGGGGNLGLDLPTGSGGGGNHR